MMQRGCDRVTDPRCSCAWSRFSLPLQVKGAHIDEFASNPHRLSILKFAMSAMIGWADVDSRNLREYLVMPPIVDMRRPCAIQLHRLYGRSWGDAFCEHNDVGRTYFMEWHEPITNWLSCEDATVAMSFAYDDK
jgi:hypothetical protein